MGEVVVARGLVRHFPAGGHTVRAVDGVDLDVEAGELVMVLGRSGAGKTTLLSLIGGLDRPDAGTVRVGGEAVEQLSGTARDHFLQSSVGWVFQTSGLMPMLTAEENVEIGLRLTGVPAHARRERAIAALERVGLAERRAHTPAELSGGEQQRVALARALAKSPQLVLADEPTAQLDSETSAGVMRLLREVVTSGSTVLMATHDALAVDFADRVLSMEDGRLA